MFELKNFYENLDEKELKVLMKILKAKGFLWATGDSPEKVHCSSSDRLSLDKETKTIYLESADYGESTFCDCIKEKKLPVVRNQSYLLELFKHLGQETLLIPEDFSSVTNSKSIQFAVADCGVVVSINNKNILLTTEKEQEQPEQNSELKQAIAVAAYYTTLNNLK